MGSPTRMAYAHREVCGISGRLPELSFKIVYFAFGLEYLNTAGFGLCQGNACTVISAILQLVESFDKKGGSFRPTYVSYNTTHIINSGLVNNVNKSIKIIKIYSTFYISHTIRTNGLLYLTGHNECPLLTILLT